MTFLHKALAMCEKKANARIQFRLADISREEETFFDLILVLDVVEHLEDYYRFLNGIRTKRDL